MWDDSVVTNAGAELLSAWAGGGTLTITKATAGDQTTAAVNLRGLTALTNEVQTVSITESRVVEGGVRYRVQFQAAESAYTAKQIGIWGRLGSGSETLIAVYQDAEGFAVAAADEMPDFVYAFMATVMMDNTGELAVTLDTSALVSQSQMEEAMEEAIGAIYPIPLAKGGTGATDAAGARANLGAVNRAGDVMTGRLVVPELRINDLQNLPNLTLYRASAAAAAFAILSGLNACITQFGNNQNKYEVYYLPRPEDDLESNPYYAILTSKAAVTLAQGGTGATDAAGARANLGAVAKTGDTMSGPLKAPEIEVDNPNGTPAMLFRQAGQRVMLMGLHASSQRAYIGEHGSNPTYYEVYLLPAVDGGLTTNAFYDILTSKAAVTLAQGGTGAVTQAGARVNLGVRSGRTAAQTIAAGAQTTVAVAFDDPFPNTSYVVCLTINGSQQAARDIAYGTTNQQADGFSIRLENTGASQASGFTVDWIAVAL